MSDIKKRLDKIIPRIKKEGFFEGRSIGNELNFHVFDYLPQDEIIVREHIAFVKKQMNKPSEAHHIVEIDLYDAMIEILETKGFVQKIFTFEEKNGTEFIIDKIQKALRLTTDGDLLVSYIKEKVNKDNIVFLTGVGKAYPIIRSHSILNNLHHVLDQNPVIMFFPGSYDGQSLSLFKLIKDDNYYRAFRLVE